MRDKLGRFAGSGVATGLRPTVRLQTLKEKRANFEKSIAGSKAFTTDSIRKIKANKTFNKVQARAATLEKRGTDSATYRSQQLRSRAQSIKRSYQIGR